MFVAVQPPLDVTEDLADYLEPRRERDSPLRWSSGDQWHLTLAFLPNLADRDLDELIELLAEAVGKRSELELRLEGAGTFPNPAQAKVLWAGVGGDTGQLANLSNATRTAASRAGCEVDGSKFRPHVTLARPKQPMDVTRWLRVFDLYTGPNWLVDEVALIESHLGAKPHHQVHETFSLAPLAV